MAPTPVRSLRFLLLLPVFALLGGCDMVLMNPSGDVAVQQRNLILASTGLMLLIILPVMAATAIFAWRYRASNTGAPYAPDWHHSTQLEVLIWTAPLLIIVALGALTWISTHVLDPFRAVGRIDAAHAMPADVKPLTIEAVALDWKWLFFYPDQGIATVNELAAPVNVPIAFKITSATVMNTLFVPAMSGQIYANGRHGDAARHRHEPPGRLRRLLGELQRGWLLEHALQVPQPRPGGIRRLGRQGQAAGQGARPQPLRGAGEAQRGGAAGLFLAGLSRPLRRDPESCAPRRARCAWAR